MAALNDVQIERFATLGIPTTPTNSTPEVAVAQAFYAAGGTGNPLQAAYNAGSTTAAYGNNTAYGTPVGAPQVVTNPDGTITTTYTYANGVGGTYTSTSATTTTASSTSATSATQDAYALIANSISTWFGGDPATTTAAANFLKSEMQNNIGPNQALVDMRNQQFYLTRFAGNTARQKAGLNVLSEAEYVALENSYSETLNGYGLNNYFGTSFQSKTAGLANLIGGDISATEFQSRVKLAEDQVINSDPNIVNQLKSFYNIDTTDLMKYYLDPTQNLSALTMKTQAAQIGTAAVEQGLTTSASSAMNLAQMGVTQNQAQSGYAAIGQMLPTATKLSQIYGNQSNGYTQTSAEAEQFNLANASAAALEKQKLIDLEKQQFQGRSGVVGANASANYSGSLGKSIQGSF